MTGVKAVTNIMQIFHISSLMLYGSAPNFTSLPISVFLGLVTCDFQFYCKKSYYLASNFSDNKTFRRIGPRFQNSHS